MAREESVFFSRDPDARAVSRGVLGLDFGGEFSGLLVEFSGWLVEVDAPAVLGFAVELWPIASSPSERRQSCRAVVNNAKLGITGRRVLSRASWGVLGPREALEALE